MKGIKRRQDKVRRNNWCAVSAFYDTAADVVEGIIRDIWDPSPSGICCDGDHHATTVFLFNGFRQMSDPQAYALK